MSREDTNPEGIVLPQESTKVDLGEDLLDKTKVVSNAASSLSGIGASSERRPPTLEEEIANGEIMFNEGLYEDAKKIFRKLLHKHPHHLQIKEFLEQIQKKELQDLLSTTEVHRPVRLGNDVDREESLSTVLDKLEEDLRLNLNSVEVKPIPDLFPDLSAEVKYNLKIQDKLKELSARDAMDWGVAHLEMGLFSSSKIIFEELLKNSEYQISGMYLLGLALIYSGECVEATIRLEPLVRNLTLTESQKSDFLYLMGLAFEKLGDARKAKDFYRRVYVLSPRYRDVVDKLR